MLALLLLLLGAGPVWGQAAPKRRAGSAPTPPVRNISPDPRDPQGPPPPGVRNTGQARIPGASTKPVPRDTLAPAPADTTLLNGVSRAGDSLQLAAKRRGQIETTITYTAKDSIQFDVTQKVARLYNGASVVYGETDLKAALITVNYGTNTMQAEGRRDSVKNRLVGRPVLKDKGGLYTAGSIAYNFKSKKAKVTEAVTTQGEGYVSAATIKRMPDGDINGLNGRYTTCNLEHPHFYIQAKKMKMIPGDKVVTGPFNLVIGDVPTPLGFLFGFFPMPDRSRGSGVLIPTFGQAADRGYFLTNGGYYFAPNDYIGVRLTGDIYAGNAQTFGGFGLTADIQYLKRYTYNGTLNLRFTNRPVAPILPRSDVGLGVIRPPANNSFWITWNHSPVPKPGGGRFTASVTAGTPGFDQAVSLDARRRLTTQYNSSISYSKQIRNSPVNYDVRVQQSQGTDGTINFTLPSLTLGVARQYPYQWFGIKPGGKYAALYEQLTVSYQGTASNELSNVVRARGLTTGLPLLGGTTQESRLPVSFGNLNNLLKNTRNSAVHNLTIGLGSYSVAKHFKLTPSVSYNEVWYSQRLSYSYSRVAQAIRIDTAYGFNRVNSYNGGLSLNTAFYGTVVRKGVRKIQAIRHKVTPALNFSYAPDFRDRSSVFQEPAQVLPASFTSLGPLDKLPFNTFDRYNGFLTAAPGGGPSSQLSFTLQNALEMKVRDPNDTTGLNPFKKVDIFRNLDFSMGYDFLEPSFKLSPLNVIFSTQIAKKLNLNSSAQFDPYQRDSRGARIPNTYLFSANPRRLLRLSTANLQANYAFNPTSGPRKSVIKRDVAPSNDPTLGTVGPPNFYADYVDFDIPWELSLNYSASYSTNPVPLRPGDPRPRLLAAHTIGGTGSVKLTENLRFSYNLNYDFVSQTLVYPNLAFTRDLHCWQITGYWVPIGPAQGYNFTIAAKSSLLQDLKLNRNRQPQSQ